MGMVGNDQHGPESAAHVGQAFETVVQRAGVEESIAARSGRTDASQPTGLLIEYGRAHSALVRGRGSRNKRG